MEKKLLPYLVVISALSVSLSAAFYSVTGIGKMFSGSSVNVMIMMASLEIAKLILASLLYQYWDKLSKLLKAYYIIAIFTLMVITSAGIYGYLSSAYSETSFKVENVDKQVSVLDVKRKMFETQLDDIRSEKQRINDNISDLTKGLSNNTQTFKDKTGAILTTTSSANRKSFESQLKSSQIRRDELSLKETALNDSITKIDLQKLDLESNANLAGEIGPLKYIAKITNRSIDEVVNWFIIALMLVFDPLAVSLVVGANVIFADKRKMKEKMDLSKEIDEKIESFKSQELEFESKKSEFESRLKEVESAEENIKKRESDLESKYKEKEKSLEEKEKELYSDLENKEKENQKDYEKVKSELEDRIKSRESELDNKLKEANLKLENLKSDEDKLRDKVRNEEVRLKKLEIELLGEKEAIKDEKKVNVNLRKEIDRQTKVLKEDKKDLEFQVSKLEEVKRELAQKEAQIEASKEEVLRIDSEIKAWESQHWKMRRTPPPSATFD